MRRQVAEGRGWADHGDQATHQLVSQRPQVVAPRQQQQRQARVQAQAGRHELRAGKRRPGSNAVSELTREERDHHVSHGHVRMAVHGGTGSTTHDRLGPTPEAGSVSHDQPPPTTPYHYYYLRHAILVLCPPAPLAPTQLCPGLATHRRARLEHRRRSQEGGGAQQRLQAVGTHLQPPLVQRANHQPHSPGAQAGEAHHARARAGTASCTSPYNAVSQARRLRWYAGILCAPNHGCGGL